MSNTDISNPDRELLANFFKTLVNRIFKILPMKENDDETLNVYCNSLQFELHGTARLIPDLGNNPRYLSLLSILENIKDYPETPVSVVRREVFNAISICNKIEQLYRD